MIYLIVIIWLLVGPFIWRYSSRHRKINIPGTSVLLVYYTDSNSLMPIEEGKLGDMHYQVIATLPKYFETGEAASICIVALPFSSVIHLVGIPKKTQQTQLNPAGDYSVMEKVELEGDYNDYFTLYTEKGMQEDSRYTLNPKAMEFTVEFCQNFSWEIVDNQLYIVRGMIEINQNDFQNLIVKFINQLKPAIGRPLTDQELQAITPYEEEYRDNLKCPICQAVLNNRQSYLVCPNGHGVLLKGSALLQLHSGNLKIPVYLLHSGHVTPLVFNCPSCGNPMELVSYNGSKSVIHTCSHCPYRWLDANYLLSSSAN